MFSLNENSMCQANKHARRQEQQICHTTVFSEKMFAQKSTQGKITKKYNFDLGSTSVSQNR